MKQKLQEDMAWGDDKPKQASPKIINAIIKPALPTRKQFRNESKYWYWKNNCFNYQLVYLDNYSKTIEVTQLCCEVARNTCG